MNLPLLQVKDISYTYHTKAGETPALSHISFSVFCREFVLLYGPCWMWQQQIFRYALRSLKTRRRELLLNGTPLSMSNTNIGYMLQKDHLFEWRTIYSNMLLGLEIQGQATPETKKHVENLLENYGLYKLRTFQPSQLSAE